MANYKQIIDSYLNDPHFAGDTEIDPQVRVEQEKNRNSFILALDIRKKECQLRGNVAIGLLIMAMTLLVTLILFKTDGLKTYKDIMGVIGGGSIAALLFYILSVRDEITKINQMLTIAPVVEKAVLDTLLLTIMGK